MKQIQKMAQRGLLDPEKEDPFSLFVASTDIRYCYYSDTHKVLGNTYGMLVLQDFEALTPNLLARTVETVEGGGIVVFLLSSLDSLTQLYSLTMDVHARLRTESHQKVVPRFNERLVLSLSKCSSCILMDDELNVLPTSSHIRAIKPVPTNPDGSLAIETEGMVATAELKELQDSLTDVHPAGALVSRCKTLDQGKAVVSFLDAASEKTLRSTVALTAARGRGKSASLGLAIAGALALGYSNIFVTAPSPENLRTLFDFIFKGLDDLDYKEHLDYDLVESTNPAFGKAIVRVNVYRSHRQTVQYIQPQHYAKLAQAELLVIDEAAAIPLPIVKNMLGPYLIFLCSTVNGYEGTGRSLSLKLIQQLRAQGAKVEAKSDKGTDGSSGGRTFREIILQEPIRYSPGDVIESWLNKLLCLDAAEYIPPVPSRLPHPEECDLYFVERDTLFSGHAASEAFLQRVMSLYVSSHYRNTPNDLLLLADAPAHQLYVLLGPVDESQASLPDVLAVVQIALEGSVSKKSAKSSLAAGQLPQGDLLPWTIGQQFQDAEFPGLSGARIVRIAVHPEIPRAGYGSRAVALLKSYFEGDIAALSEDEDVEMPKVDSREQHAVGERVLLSESLGPRSNLPPLLTDLPHRTPEPLHYLGTSFGLTQELYNFWKKNGYLPMYLRQTPSEVTGEHTILMLHALKSDDVSSEKWLDPFVVDFRLRFQALLAGRFRNFGAALCLTILDPRIRYPDADAESKMEAIKHVLRPDGKPLSPYDMKRLQAYSSNLVDHHLILDLLPSLARAYFSGHIPATLSYSQAAILLTLGLQCKTVDDIAQDLGLPASQILALFSKSIRKLHAHLHAGKQAQIARKLPARKELKATTSLLKPYAVGVDEDLEEGAAEIQKEYENYKAQALSEKELGNLEQYAIKGTAEDVAMAATGAELTPGGLISVKVSSKDTKEKKKKGRKQRDETAGDSKKTKKKKSKR
jgi:N-acetyltransferase 10